MTHSLVIVESPAKAKTINKYLGKDFTVLASYGHVRDLPPKDGSVLPDEDFAMSWTTDARSKPRMTDITKAMRNSDKLILATDPDREGEAISWHVLQMLQDKKVIKDKPVERVVFNAITKKSVLEAMDNPREIDSPLVEAYLARRALDYLVGFTLSPVLWRKLPGARSAGRVQSVALRLVCEREAEIEAFVPVEYWSILASLKNSTGVSFEAKIAEFDGQKLQRTDIPNEAMAMEIKAALEAGNLKVQSVEAKPTKRNPYAPFTTSTMQMDASRRLNFTAKQTMQVAQKLYEGVDIGGGETVGLITYMRTDGVQIAPEAVAPIREQIAQSFSPKHVPDAPRVYNSKAKNAQEAHEAIRPTEISRSPKEMKQYLNDEMFKLYDLIWKRTIASQMASADIERTAVDIVTTSGKPTRLRANGSVVIFDGFLAAYEEAKSESDDEDDKRLPALKEGEEIEREKIEAKQHFTDPPARYSEASLIRKMEDLGIGRPSTYASVLSTLQDRDYVILDKRRFTPDSKGRVVTSFLQSFFNRYVEYDFTANLEEQLDQISAGDLQWKDVLRDFWKQFKASVDETKDLRVSEVLDTLNVELAPLAFPPREDGRPARECPTCKEGELSLKVGKFGAFVGCSNYPDCKYTRQLGQSDEEAAAQALAEGPKVLGIDPNSSEEVTLRTGRFGPYIQRGEGTPKEVKRAGIPKGWDPLEVDFEKALQLLSLPREVGAHPETGKMITSGIGRYGPFVLHDGLYANMESVDDAFTIGINHAVTLLAEKAAKGGRRGAAAALKDLGDHPDGESGKITVNDGRYGPYIKCGKVNATIPKDTDPQSVTLEQAVQWIAEKVEKTGKTPTGKKKAAPKKKAAAKKKPAAKKKTTAKKPVAKKE
jgi:DNA topoisomerase-1